MRFKLIALTGDNTTFAMTHCYYFLAVSLELAISTHFTYPIWARMRVCDALRVSFFSQGMMMIDCVNPGREEVVQIANTGTDIAPKGIQL